MKLPPRKKGSRTGADVLYIRVEIGEQTRTVRNNEGVALERLTCTHIGLQPRGGWRDEEGG